MQDELNSLSPFSRRLKAVLRAVPAGKIITYGLAAGMAGNPRGARQVSRFLHSSARYYHLPWHRVIGSSGRISLPGEAGLLQQRLLADEGVVPDAALRYDFDKYLFTGPVNLPGESPENSE